MNIKRNIIFAIEKRKTRGQLIIENVPIRMRVIFAGERIEFTTGFRIDAQKWDDTKQRVKNGCANILKQSSAEINFALSEYESTIQLVFKKFEITNILPTREDVRNAFNAKYTTKEQQDKNTNTEEKKLTFFEVFDLFMREEGRMNNWTLNTHEKFTNVKSILTAFDKNLAFEDLHVGRLMDYIYFLQDVRKQRNSTIAKQLSFLKWFLRWATSNGYNTKLDYVDFKPKLKTTQAKVIFLNQEELAQIRTCSIPPEKEYLERVRDVLLFCSFTGLRHSDVYNLKKSDIKENHIEITTVKTADSLIIEFNKHSQAIIKKYEKEDFDNDRALPVISNQKMNDYLKELGELAEINEPIRETFYKGNLRHDLVQPKYKLLSTHVGRRTFICNALALGIPVNVVMKWTGHSDYKAMKPYIDIADSIKASAMNKFNMI